MTTARKAPAKEPGVILLTGVEEFLVRRELDALTAQHVSQETRDFDFVEYRSTDVDAATLWNALITLPLLARKRVVILHINSVPKDELLDVLKRYAAGPSQTTLLIIVQVLEDREIPLSLDGHVSVHSFPLLKREDQRRQWAQEYVRKEGKELLPEAAEYLVGTSSSHLSDLAAKLEHAILYAGDSKQITGEVLMAVSGVTSEYQLYHIDDPILERHASEVFDRVSSLEAGGEELLRLLASQRGFLMRLWQVGALARKLGIRKLDKTGRDLLYNESRAILGNRAFRSTDMCQAYWSFGETKIRDAMVELLNLEIRVKTGKADWKGYYDWVWKLISPGPSFGTSNIT